MKATILLCAVVALCVIHTAFGDNVGIRDQIRAKNTPSRGTYDKRKKEVDASFGGLRGAKKSKLRGPQKVELSLDGKKGGQIDGRRHNAVGDWEKQRSGNMDADLSVAGRKLTGEGTSKGKFDTVGNKGNKQHFTQQRNSKGNSQGVVELEHRSGKATKANGDYNYKVDTPQKRGGRASFADAKGSPGRSSLKLDCKSPKVGETGCSNQAGKKTPTAVVDEDGHARLTKDGTAVARVNVVKSGRKGRREFVTNVEGKQSRSSRRSSKPLYTSKVNSFKTSDCYREITKKNDPDPNDVKFIKKTIKFRYNSKTDRGGAATYTFPDCFNVEAEIQLGPNIAVSDLAVEFQARINPLGDLACADPATCGRGSCYYCDFCTEEARKLEVVKNIDNEDTCDTKTGRRSKRFKLSATFCPPPPDDDLKVCTSFQKPYTSSFWTNSKENSIVTRILIWERPKNTQQLSDRFFYCINGGSGCSLIGDFRSQLKVSYLLEQGIKRGVSQNVPDEVLHDYYIRQKLGRTKADFKEELKACSKGEMDYDIAGTKTSGKFMVEMADALKRKGFGIENAFVKAPCPAVQRLETQEYQAAQKAWKAGGSKKGSDGGLLSSFGSFGRPSSSSSSTGRGGSSSSSTSTGGRLGGLFNRFGG